jgi:hypothetical protein
MTLIQVGGLAGVGQPDPNAQEGVGELARRVGPVAEPVEGPEGAVLAGDVLPQPQMQGAAEPGRVARMPVSPLARWGVRARTSSTGTIPGTPSAGGST